ncbi:hypothetical protein L686_09120 [Stutzerimonas stutzeri MF28]|uniref:Uncharacterized protein n=1 Tax=Stutzerimonas stutzeri TaxID=316 RepID=A0A2N8SUY1_STUST|nr:hypothetical protein L686_09120 [Stutzerimonas stutzeri MF28]PNG06281.1 hypothetical protein CXL00_10740 [Stutzerimonas stutzeri]
MADFLIIQSIMKVNMFKRLGYIFTTTLLFIPGSVHLFLKTQTDWLDACQHAGGEDVLCAAPRQAHATEAT